MSPNEAELLARARATKSPQVFINRDGTTRFDFINPDGPDLADALEAAWAERDALEAQNKRYAEALDRICLIGSNWQEYAGSEAAEEMERIAREALNPIGGSSDDR